MTYAYAADAVAEVAATTEALFDCLDDQASLGAHMEKPSAMMLGGRMIYQLDAAQGRAAGAVIRMRGNILWLKISVEEVVVERTRPLRKTWETRGRPVLLIIGSYRMGFEIEAAGPRQRLRVFISYDHPASIVGGMLAKLLAGAYARWCVTRMTDEARRHFS
ncbi:MAG: hypothetical protein Q8R82_07980 [Hyphomonadaceae bacterium]|nr:hypothetical protein [Hyphomonadaceae bacterium]